MAGHVFVTRGDLSKLRCNAWLLPTDAALHVTDAWREAAPERHRRFMDGIAVPEHWNATDHRSMPIAPWYDADGDVPAPVPFLTNIGGTATSELAWYLEGVDNFIASAAELPKTTQKWRNKRLFALPFVGSGAGGRADAKGPLARELVRRLEHLAKEYDVDIALVLKDEAAFSAMQRLRDERSWDDLQPPLREAARRLAKLALKRELVVFFGAGVSIPAGLPSWKDLISRIARAMHMTDAEMKALEAFQVLDGAAIVEAQAAANGDDFRRAIAAACEVPLYGMPHALIASLDLREAVTTNYDDLYERAFADAGTKRKLSVLPHKPLDENDGWLLKLHGCVTKPEDIVVTRKDYLRYESSRSALQGIVQAMLITRHILFVGFSLSDENFHTLIDAVRRAVDPTGETPPSARRAFGTAVIQSPGALFEQPWTGDLVIAPARGDDSDLGYLVAARQTEIFLDYLTHLSTTPASHLLDETYGELLDPKAREIKAALLRLRSAIESGDASEDDGLAYGPLRGILERYGSPRAT